MTVPAVEAVEAVVREWHDEEGWGVLDCEHSPGGCWTHYSAVAIKGYRRLSAGQRVWLEWETAEQDGYHYRAVRTWPCGADPVDPPASRPPGSAYRSTLRIEPPP